MSFDAAAAKQVKGVTDVVQVPEGVGVGVAVVATGTWAALCLLVRGSRGM